MCDQNEVLRALVGLGPSLSPGVNCAATIDELLALCGYKPKHRKSVVECLGRLMQKKLAERSSIGTAFYRASAAGVAFAQSGKRITAGPNAASERKPLEDTFRARLWRALRVRKKATLPDLIEIARKEGDGDFAHVNAQSWMRSLCAAGIAVKLPTRAEGYAPTSNGFARFALIRDLGPLAPVISSKHLVNPNAQGDARFIKYAEAER